jgi:Protein of unknown function (DUF2281)
MIFMEQTLLQTLRMLPTEKQQEVLDFAQFLAYQARQAKQLPNDSYESNILPTKIEDESYLIDPAITRSHDAFLKGYAPEDEGLYDDY